MDTQIRKGLLEAYILSLLRNGPTYGYKLVCDIASYMDISESTLYPILRRLEQQQLLETFQELVDGRIRKYYVITAEGIKRHLEYITMCQEVKKIISIIEGEKHE